jgi:PHD-like zinc-binding domain
MLCPNSIVGEPLLPAGADKFAHRICAEYIPETYLITNEDGTESVSGIESITPARWNLKCLYCGSTRGAKFQCSATSCCRAYHATCAAAAGVLVETAEDELGFVSSYQCRFHRPRRSGAMYLEQDASIVEYARQLQPGNSIQGRLTSADSDIPFVGTVIENCESEETVSVELATG